MGGLVEGKGVSMVRKALRAGVFAALGMIVLVGSYGIATSADDKVPEVSTIMMKSFGKEGFKSQIQAAVKGEKWEDANKLAKEWNELGGSIGKNKAPKGEAKSWEELCKKFADNTKAIVEGTDKKDAKAVTKAIGSFNCNNCHKAHKGA
jgi:hypothetical protein